jgi:hypothetical protein
LELPFFPEKVEVVNIPGLTHRALQHEAMTILPVTSAAEFVAAVKYLVESAFEPWSKAQLLLTHGIPYDIAAEYHKYMADRGIIWLREDRNDPAQWIKESMDAWIVRREKSWKNLEAFMNKPSL